MPPSTNAGPKLAPLRGTEDHYPSICPPACMSYFLPFPAPSSLVLENSLMELLHLYMSQRAHEEAIMGEL